MEETTGNDLAMAGQESPIFLAQGEHIRAYAVTGDPLRLSGRHRSLRVFAVALSGVTYWSGVWATAILLKALAVTPAATIFRWPALVDMRRMIGVTALVYTIAHVVIYFAFRHGKPCPEGSWRPLMARGRSPRRGRGWSNCFAL
jgi:hypothetical protein